MTTENDKDELHSGIELVMDGVRFSVESLRTEEDGRTGSISISQHQNGLQSIDFSNFSGRLRVVSNTRRKDGDDEAAEKHVPLCNGSLSKNEAADDDDGENDVKDDDQHDDSDDDRSDDLSFSISDIPIAAHPGQRRKSIVLNKDRPFRLHHEFHVDSASDDQSENEIATSSLSHQPLHAVCASHTATLEQLQQALREHPTAALQPDKDGQFPLHILSENMEMLDTQAGREDAKEFSLRLVDQYLDAMTFKDSEGHFPFMQLIEHWVDTTYRSAGQPSSHTFNLKRALSGLSLSRHGSEIKDSPTGDTVEEEAQESSHKRWIFRQESSFDRKFSNTMVKESEDTSIGGPYAYKLCPYVALPPHVEWAFSMLSTILTRINDEQQVPIRKRDEILFVWSTIAKGLASIPYLLKTILLIEQDETRVRLLREPVVRRLLLTPLACGRWICPMLHRRGFASKRAVDYFEEISRVPIAGYVGPKRTPRSQDVQAFESDRAAVFATLGSIKRLIPSLALLDQKETEQAAATDVVWDIVSRSMSRPIVVGILAIDLVYHMILMLVFRFDMSHKHFDLIAKLPEDKAYKMSVALIISISIHFLLRRLCEVFSLLRISKRAFYAYSLDVWNVIDVAAVILTLISCFRGGNRPVLFAVTSLMLWLRLLGFLKAINMEFSTFILAIIEIMKDIKWFLVVLSLFIFMFADMIHIITTRSESDYCADGAAPSEFCSEDSISPSYLKLYSVVVGDVQLDDFSYSPAVSFLFCIFTLYGVIVLLNVLIAIVSDSYQKSVMRSKFLFGRARVGFAVTHVAQEQFLQGTPMPPFEGIHLLCNTGFNLWIVGSIGRWIMLASLVWTFGLAEAYMVIMVMENPEDGHATLGVVTMILTVTLSIMLFVSMMLLLQNLFEDVLNRTTGYLHLSGLNELVKSLLHWILQLITENILGIHRTTGLAGHSDWHGKFEFIERTMYQMLSSTEQQLSNSIQASEQRIKTHDSQVGEEIKIHTAQVVRRRQK